jgi:hypothetical protein
MDAEKLSEDGIRTHPSPGESCFDGEAVVEEKMGISQLSNNNPRDNYDVVSLGIGEENSNQSTGESDTTNTNISDCKLPGGVNPSGLLLKGIKVLLAEDNLVNQKVACQQLKKFGTEVEVVSDGQQCLNALHKDREKYDLILMDVQVCFRFPCLFLLNLVRSESQVFPIICILLLFHSLFLNSPTDPMEICRGMFARCRSWMDCKQQR